MTAAYRGSHSVYSHTLDPLDPLAALLRKGPFVIHCNNYVSRKWKKMKPDSERLCWFFFLHAKGTFCPTSGVFDFVSVYSNFWNLSVQTPTPLYSDYQGLDFGWILQSHDNKVITSTLWSQSFTMHGFKDSAELQGHPCWRDPMPSSCAKVIFTFSFSKENMQCC